MTGVTVTRFLCDSWVSCSEANKDLGLKAKAKDLDSKAKDLSAKTKNLGPKAQDSTCQAQMFHQSFYIVFNVHVLWVFLCSRTISCLNCILSVYE